MTNSQTEDFSPADRKVHDRFLSKEILSTTAGTLCFVESFIGLYSLTTIHPRSNHWIVGSSSGAGPQNAHQINQLESIGISIDQVTSKLLEDPARSLIERMGVNWARLNRSALEIWMKGRSLEGSLDIEESHPIEIYTAWVFCSNIRKTLSIEGMEIGLQLYKNPWDLTEAQRAIIVANGHPLLTNKWVDGKKFRDSVNYFQENPNEH